MSENSSSSDLNEVPSYKQTGRNVLFIWINRTLGIVTPIIITPIITHGLGLDLVGVWLMVTQLTSHLMLLDGGFVNSLVRFLSSKRALKDTDGASQYIATAFYVLLSVSCFIVLCSPVIRYFFLKSLHISEANSSNVNILIFIAIISVSMSLPMRIGYGLLSSLHRFDRIQFFDSIFIVCKLVLILILFRLGTPSLPYLGLIVFGTSLLGVSNIFVEGLFRNRDLSLRPSFVSISALCELTSMGGAALFVSCASIILLQSSAMITGYILGPSSVALISYPLMIYTSLTPFAQVIALIIIPMAAAMAATKKDEGMGVLVLLSAKYQSAASFLILLILITLAQPFLELWLSGPKLKNTDIHTMSTCLIILFSGYTFSSVAQVGRSVLNSSGFHWRVAMVELGSAIVGLALIFYLIKFFNYGVIGTSVGIASVFFIRGMILYPIILRNVIKCSPIYIVIKSIGVPFITAIIAGLIGFISNYYITKMFDNVFIVLFIVFCIQIIFWFFSTLFFVLSSSHRKLLIEKIVKK